MIRSKGDCPMKKNVCIRTLSMLLVLLTLCSGMTVLADGTFTDSYKIGVPYGAAVDYMVEEEILTGFPDGSFLPTGTLTREQAAKIVASLVLGVEEADALTVDAAPFDDVAAGRWSAKYIAWCAENEIVGGKEGNAFHPTANVTGYEFGKMLLCAFGYGKSDDYVGSAWTSAVAADGKAIELYNGDDTMTTNAALTRQQAALMAYNAVKAGSQNGIDELMVVETVNLTMLRNDGAQTGVPRYYRNLDESIGFAITLGHEPTKTDGYITLKLRVSEYDSNRIICSYIFNGDVLADKDSTTVTYNGSIEDLLAYDESLCRDYFTDVNKYKVEVILESRVLKAFSFNVAFNTLSADAFARQLEGEGRFWISTVSGELVAESSRVYSERFIGMTRTLGAQFDLSKADAYEGRLPVTFKWSKDGDPLCQETRIVSFDGAEMTLDSFIYNANNSTLDEGAYTCTMYIFNTEIASADCKLVD